MPYVMVPVPEEYEAEVTRHVLQLTIAAALHAWTAEEIADLHDRLDPGPREVLVAIAKMVAAQQNPDDRRVATTLDISTSEVVAGVVAVTNECEAMGKVSLVLMDNGPDAVAADNTEVVRSLLLAPQFASAVLAAAERDPNGP